MGGKSQVPGGSISLLRIVVLGVVLANLVDALLTLFWVSAGIATEANVLMAVLLDHSAVAFMVVKMLLVSGGVLVMWNLRARSRLAVPGLVGCCGAYCLLLFYHFGIAAAAIEFA